MLLPGRLEVQQLTYTCFAFLFRWDSHLFLLQTQNTSRAIGRGVSNHSELGSICFITILIHEQKLQLKLYLVQRARSRIHGRKDVVLFFKVAGKIFWIIKPNFVGHFSYG